MYFKLKACRLDLLILDIKKPLLFTVVNIVKSLVFFFELILRISFFNSFLFKLYLHKLTKNIMDRGYL